MSTPTFYMCYQDDKTEEVERTLRSLETGSSSKSRSTSALQAFQEVTPSARLCTCANAWASAHAYLRRSTESVAGVAGGGGEAEIGGHQTRDLQA